MSIGQISAIILALATGIVALIYLSTTVYYAGSTKVTMSHWILAVRVTITVVLIVGTYIFLVLGGVLPWILGS